MYPLRDDCFPKCLEFLGFTKNWLPFDSKNSFQWSSVSDAAVFFSEVFLYAITELLRVEGPFRQIESTETKRAVVRISVRYLRRSLKRFSKGRQRRSFVRILKSRRYLLSLSFAHRLVA